MSPHTVATATQVSFHTRAEDLLGTLRGVTAVSIDRLEDRRVTELRVVSTDEMTRRQVERNLASALMAGFGIDLQPGSIRFVQAIERSAASSPQVAAPVTALPAKLPAKRFEGRASSRSASPRVANKLTSTRTTEVTSIDARVRAAEAEAVELDAPIVPQNFALVDVQMTELADGRFRYTVTLDARGGKCVGEVEGAGSEQSRIECAARAVVEASRSVLSGRLWYVLDGVRLVELMCRSYVLSAVRTSDGDARVTSAAVAVETTFEHASAAATVNALNS